MAAANDKEVSADVFAHIQKLELRAEGHDERITGVERQLGAFAKENRTAFAAINGQLQDISRAVTIQSARPDFNIYQTLQIVSVCVFLFTAAAGGIVTLATYVAAGNQAKTDERVAQLEKQLARWDNVAAAVVQRHFMRAD